MTEKPSEKRKNQNQRIIGVLSGKGGVGKSVLAVNLTAMLTRMGKTCILVDADLSNPSVGLHLGLSYTSIGLQDALFGRHKVLDSIIIQPTTGMRVLPASLKYDSNVKMDNLKSVLRSLSAYDFVIVDSPPGITNAVEQIILACDDAIVVTTPDIPSVTSASKVASLCKKYSARVTGVVVNRVVNERFELSRREIESMTESSVIVDIPEDIGVPSSIATRTPIVLRYPRSIVAQKLKLVALFLVQADSHQEGTQPSGASGFLVNLFHRIFGL